MSIHAGLFCCPECRTTGRTLWVSDHGEKRLIAYRIEDVELTTKA